VFTLAALVLGGGVLAAARVRARGARVHREAGLDVLLVTIDTLRADALGYAGNARSETPWIDRLAAGGVRFSGAQAHNVVTLPSHANILSGRLPFAHGVRDNAGFRLPPDLPTLATLLAARGYRTGAFVSAFTLDSQFGLDRGFSVYDDSFTSGRAPVAFELPERAAAETVALARRWMDAGDGRPTFTWVHLYDPHAPYVPPEPFASRFAGQPYLGEVAATDAALEPLLRPLLEAGERGRTLLVLTGDHGESLGEHGERTHGVFAYEATLHVPLLVYCPRLFAPRAVGERVQHVDLLPTILDAVGQVPPGDLPGRSLVDTAAGAATPAGSAYFEALSGQTTRGWAPLFGVVRGGWKYVDLPLPELYDLGRDPREEHNQAAVQPAALERLRAALAPFRDADRGSAAAAGESAETRARLRALGYLAAPAAPATPHAYTADDDPKRLIDLDAQIEAVLARHRAGDLEGALALCEDVVRRRPGMHAALLQLALLRRKLGRLPAAIAALEQALAVAPDDAGTAALLAGYLGEAGRAREGERLLEAFARRPRPALEVLVAHGIALAQLGRAREAAAELSRASALDPSNAMTRVQLGTALLMADDLGGARAALDEALRLDPRLAVAHRTLGQVAARSGDQEAARRQWEAALELDPQEHDALLQLGTALARAGRTDEARAYLERFVAGAPPDVYAGPLAAARAWLGRQEAAPRGATSGPTPRRAR